jgi:hypothetical protein
MDREMHGRAMPTVAVVVMEARQLKNALCGNMAEAQARVKGLHDNKHTALCCGEEALNVHK